MPCRTSVSILPHFRLWMQRPHDMGAGGTQSKSPLLITLKSKHMGTHITIFEAIAVSALSLFGYVFFKTLFDYLKRK